MGPRFMYLFICLFISEFKWEKSIFFCRWNSRDRGGERQLWNLCISLGESSAGNEWNEEKIMQFLIETD